VIIIWFTALTRVSILFSVGGRLGKKEDLAKLKAEVIIEMEGPDKGGSWKVK
jgi:hypothetical protein